MTGTEHEVRCGAAETATCTGWLTMTAGTGAKAAWSDTAEIYGPHSRATTVAARDRRESRYPSLVTRPASMNSSRIERWSRTYLPSFT
jgi:hypothetical protein